MSPLCGTGHQPRLRACLVGLVQLSSSPQSSVLVLFEDRVLLRSTRLSYNIVMALTCHPGHSWRKAFFSSLIQLWSVPGGLVLTTWSSLLGWLNLSEVGPGKKASGPWWGGEEKVPALHSHSQGKMSSLALYLFPEGCALPWGQSTGAPWTMGTTLWSHEPTLTFLIHKLTVSICHHGTQ